jgi:hypothetical protein
VMVAPSVATPTPGGLPTGATPDQIRQIRENLMRAREQQKGLAPPGGAAPPGPAAPGAQPGSPPREPPARPLVPPPRPVTP